MTVSNELGHVYVVATPIGNLEDLSPRALRVLREVDVIACEDTRRTAKICSHFDIGTPRVSLHAHNEERRIPALLARLEAGEDIALVSDAGTPLLSDPGALLTAAAIEKGITIIPVPGPSAILAALVASGLATRPFTFVGFLPRKGRARADWLARLRELPGAIVLFEAPGRVRQTLLDLHAALGPREVAVARELTKRFEETVRGTLGEIALAEPRGEVTLVIAAGETVGDPAGLAPEEEEALVERILATGVSTRDAARELAVRGRISKSEAYRRVLALSRSRASE